MTRRAVGEESFDVAIATEVIEHLVRPRDLPRFATRLLQAGGYLIISTPYHRLPEESRPCSH